jgi:hypothetical protein
MGLEEPTPFLGGLQTLHPALILDLTPGSTPQIGAIHLGSGDPYPIRYPI